MTMTPKEVKSWSETQMDKDLRPEGRKTKHRPFFLSSFLRKNSKTKSLDLRSRILHKIIWEKRVNIYIHEVGGHERDTRNGKGSVKSRLNNPNGIEKGYKGKESIEKPWP